MVHIPFIEGPFFDALERNADFQTVEGELLRLINPLGIKSVASTDIRGDMFNSPEIGHVLGKSDTEYITRYRQGEFAKRDVTILRTLRTRTPFSWEDAMPMADTTERKEVFGAAGEHGYHDGWIVPHHGAGMGVGVTSFMGDRLCDRPGSRRLLTHIADLFYRYAKQKARENGQVDETDMMPDLTPRQRQLCFFIAQGKTDKEMARQLDIAVKTVNHHMETLRRKFHANTRTELLAKVISYNLYGPHTEE